MVRLAKLDETLYKVPLTALFTLSLFGFILIALWFPLFPNVYTVPQLDVRAFSPTLLLGLLYALLILILYWIYLHIYHRLKTASTRRPLASLLLITAVYCLPLMLTYPINATDIYRYVVRGRIKSVYGLNQFTTPPNGIPNDLLAPFAGEWAEATSPYGPLWELIATAVTAVTQDNLGAGLLTFKGVGLACHLAIGILVWHLAQARDAHSASAKSWLWLGNPALLFIFVENGHNDALMLFWGMLSIYFLRQKRPVLAMLFAILAPLTKPIGLLILPFIGLAAWRQFPRWQQKMGYMVASLALFILLAGLAFLPFGSPLALVQRLQGELTGGASFSPMTLLILILFEWDVSFTFAQLSWIAQGIYAVVALWLLWVTFNGRSPYRTISNIFIGYLLQAFNFRIWYASWLFPWLLIEEPEESFWLNTAVFFLLTSQLSVIIYGHLMGSLFNGNIFYTHLVGVLFTFALPPLLATRYKPLATR